MKLTVLLILAFSLGALADGHAQKIDLSVESATMKRVLRELRKQSGYAFIYKDDYLRNTLPVTAHISGKELTEALPEIFDGQPVDYRIEGKVITIMPRSQAPMPHAIPAGHGNEALGGLVLAYPIVSGRIVDSMGVALVGASVRVLDTEGKRTALQAKTDHDGHFTLRNVPDDAQLEISYIGYVQQVAKASAEMGSIVLHIVTSELEEVLVSTGYQTIPKERATGSFVFVDSALLNRRVGANILGRLDGVTSGLLFNRTKTGNNTPDISIRNRSTIFANPEPLVILDDFPYDGSLNNINPQDVQSITVLKDASAASIWGARAGNGVIVITTKKGALNTSARISANTNVTIGAKPDIFRLPQLTGLQFIEVEETLFAAGRYNSTINNRYGAISPAVSVLLSHRNGHIGDGTKRRMLDSIAAYDTRHELNGHYRQLAVDQQHQLRIEGGGAHNRYYISSGYDRTRPTERSNSNGRFTLNANNTVNLARDRVRLSSGLLLTRSNGFVGSQPYTPLFPYERTVDEWGDALAVIDRNRTLNLEYALQAQQSGLLDWQYRPYDELRNGYFSRRSGATDYRLNNVLEVRVMEGFNFSGHYNFQQGTDETVTLSCLESWNARNQINQLTRITQPGGELVRPLPLGGIHDRINHGYLSHSGRMQVSLQKAFATDHEVNAIAGYELKHYRSDWGAGRLYGYDVETATDQNSAIDFSAQHPLFYNAGLTTRIQTGNSSSWSVDRFRSYYANFSYTYRDRYVASGSARKDASNIFGVETNRKGVPLWSAGFLWDIGKEPLFDLATVSQLRLRATYGFNGNVDKATSSYLTARRLNITNTWGSPYLEVQNPPNPSLRWERVENINLGLEWSLVGGRMGGSLEFWRKRGTDLIGNSPIAPQTGVEMFRGNSADMVSRGIDLTLHAELIRSAPFGWKATLLANRTSDRITGYFGGQLSNNSIMGSNFMNPLEGYSYYALFATRFAGLDEAGNPLFLRGGTAGRDYNAILNGTDTDDIAYMGTVTPRDFGSLRNDLHWKGIEVSFNITYKAGHRFRRQSLNNATLYALNADYRQADFDNRWKAPGDEHRTTVPSLTYPANSARSNAYANADILIERGDHIRLQDLRMACNVKGNARSGGTRPSLQIYLYADNILIVWKATDANTDPDNPNGLPPVRQVSAGLKIDF